MYCTGSSRSSKPVDGFADFRLYESADRLVGLDGYVDRSPSFEPEQYLSDERPGLTVGIVRLQALAGFGYALAECHSGDSVVIYTRPTT